MCDRTVLVYESKQFDVNLCQQNKFPDTVLKTTDYPDFKFKYVPESQFVKVIKKVRRDRQSKKERLEWERYLAIKNGVEREKQKTITVEGCEKPSTDFGLVLEQDGASELAEQNIVTKKNSTNLETSLRPVRKCISTESELQAALDFGSCVLRAEDVAARLESVRQKVCQSLARVQRLIQRDGPVHPDSEDEERSSKRATEFTARFTRNHLYQMRRQVQDVKKTVTSKAGHVPVGTVLQKLLSTYQTAIQALQVMEKYMASGYIKEVSTKTKEFLATLIELVSVTPKLASVAGSNDPIAEQCTSMLDTLEAAETLHGAEQLPPPPPQAYHRSRPCSSRASLRQAPTDLSMYVTPARMRRSATTLARAKFGPPPGSRVVKDPVKQIKEPAPTKKDYSESGEDCKLEKPGAEENKVPKWRNATRGIKEDEVKTVMQEITPIGSPIGIGSAIGSERGKKLEKNLSVKCGSERSLEVETNKNHVQGIEPLLHLEHEAGITDAKPVANIGWMKSMLEHIIKELDTGQVAASKSNRCVRQQKRNSLCSASSQEMNNAKLICVTESEDICLRKNDTMPQTTGNLKQSPIPLIMSEDDQKNLLEYKARFNVFTQSCSMYDESINDPWQIIASVSDGLVEDILKEIASEVETSSFIENLFDLEFEGRRTTGHKAFRKLCNNQVSM